MTALEGKRVVVTRAWHQSAPFAAMLRSRGARPLLFPTIDTRAVTDTRALDSAVNALARFSWIVFTSANAVDAFWGRALAIGVGAPPSGLRIATVGPATSDAVRRYGLHVDAQPPVFAGKEIAAAMGDIGNTPVLFPRGDRARDETAHALVECGARVTEVVVYHTTTPAPDPVELKQLRAGVDALTFWSPLTVHGFVSMLGAEAHALAARAAVVSIGPSTSAAVREALTRDPDEAAAATSDGVMTALEAHFAPVPAHVSAAR